jgi:D-alanine--D-alanine ligase
MFMKAKKIAVVMGGPSTEREVSLNTGKAILNALQEKGYDAVGIDLEPSAFIQQLQEHRIEYVFNAVHGQFGEDGVMQGALELMGIPYTGSGVLASAIAMDKGISKKVFLASGIPTPRSRLFDKEALKQNQLSETIAAEFTFPLVVKATSQGSSIGVMIVKTQEGLPAAITQAFQYSRQILVEEFIKGKELTVAIFGGDQPEALPVIEIVPHSGAYDYHSKYTKGATEYIVPARLSADITKNVQEVAVDAFVALGCKGIARVDIMLDEENAPQVLEVNTIPGMTATSLVPKAAAAAGISFADLCERLLLTLKDR